MSVCNALENGILQIQNLSMRLGITMSYPYAHYIWINMLIMPISLSLCISLYCLLFHNILVLLPSRSCLIADAGGPVSSSPTASLNNLKREIDSRVRWKINSSSVITVCLTIFITVN